MCRYFVVLLLIFLQYTAHGQLEGNTTTVPNIGSESSSTSESRIPIISGTRIPVVVHCPVNEIWSQCGRLCERTCELPNGPPCPRIMCIHQVTGGCTCQENYVRNVDGKCVLLKDCDEVV